MVPLISSPKLPESWSMAVVFWFKCWSVAAESRFKCWSMAAVSWFSGAEGMVAVSWFSRAEGIGWSGVNSTKTGGSGSIWKTSPTQESSFSLLPCRWLLSKDEVV